jgi:hypothetical protein
VASAEQINVIVRSNRGRIGLTRLRISDLARARAWLHAGELTSRKLCIGAGRDSLHRLVRPLT